MKSFPNLKLTAYRGQFLQYIDARDLKGLIAEAP